MRKAIVILAIVALAVPAFAELQNVVVGGQIRIRGDYFINTNEVTNTLRWPAGLLNRRPTGGNINSAFRWDDTGADSKFVEQRSLLNVRADFTDEVSAFIELDSYDIWGEDFRSNYVTGADGRAVTNDDVEVYQSYIEAREMFGMPVRMRVGRQELILGSEWLVGNNDTSAGFRGLSFDALRMTYATDMLSVDAIYSKLVERSPIEEDGDVDMYAVYASYLGMEDITLDAYWILVRDARELEDTATVFLADWVEHNILKVDDYDTSYLNTIGLRGAGTFGAFDFEAEVAYQFGNDGQVAFAQKLNGGGIFGAYGEDDADFGEFGANVEVGYTFDMTMNPRVYLGAAYLGGEDNRDITFWEFINPFRKAEASISFNRLFSDVEYSEFLENTDLSNVMIIRGGVSASVTESVDVALALSYFQALEEFDAPWSFEILGTEVVPFPGQTWWTQENDSNLGLEVGLYATYNYSEDLTFDCGWAHLFVDDGLEDGQFTSFNGLGFNGAARPTIIRGGDTDDPDYLFVEANIAF